MEKIVEMFELAFRELGIEIPLSEWPKLFEKMKPLAFSKKSPLVRCGEKTDAIFFVTNGLLKGGHIDSSGKMHTRLFAAEGQFITPYASILRDQPSDIEISAIEDSQVLCFSHSYLKSLYSEHSCWIHLGRSIAEKILLEKTDREFELQALKPAERYEVFCKNKPELISRIPQFEVASYIGVTTVALSNIRQRRS